MDGISAKEFEILLWVFYNPYVHQYDIYSSTQAVSNNNLIHSKYSLYDADVETWRIILNLSNRLQFKEVKELAIRELHKKRELPLVEKMALYQQHEVDQRHLVPLFAELVSRDTALTFEESKILGPESTFLVYTARERVRSPSSEGDRSPLPSEVEEKDVYTSIEKLLEMRPGSTLEFHQNSTRKSANSNASLSISRIMSLFVITDHRANGHQGSTSHHGRGRGTFQLNSPRTPSGRRSGGSLFS